MRSVFLKKGNPIFSIKLRQRLTKSFSQLHVENSRLVLSYFLKKDDWPKAYAGPRLPALPYSRVKNVFPPKKIPLKSSKKMGTLAVRIQTKPRLFMILTNQLCSHLNVTQ